MMAAAPPRKKTTKTGTEQALTPTTLGSTDQTEKVIRSGPAKERADELLAQGKSRSEVELILHQEGFSDTEVAQGLYGQKATPEAEEEEEQSTFEAAVEKAVGLPVGDPNELITLEQFKGLLEKHGVDLEADEVVALLTVAPAMSFKTADNYAAVLALTYPTAAATGYGTKLIESGFNTAPVQLGATTPSEVRGGLPPSQAPDVPTTGGKSFTRHPETGWLAYGGGVLSNPDTGEVVFDPNSTAPGSALWRQKIQESWSEEKITAERKRLVEYGYLSADAAKLKGFDATFLSALTAYHFARYANFGKPVADDLGVAGGAAQGPLVNFEDFQAQTRNDVREEYRRVFNEDPTDGEVEAFTSMIIRKGMELQKRYRRKGYGSYSSLAATEAEEQFIEKLEQSPEAVFLREADQENTRLHDALTRAVQVTNSLAG
jgi:hypothetical protein